MPPAFRLAVAADAQEIRALVERAYRGDAARGGWTHEADLLDGNRTSLAEIAGILAAPHQFVMLVEMVGRLVGSVTITGLGENRAYLGMLAVDPAMQAGGIGRALIGAAEAEAIRRWSAAIMEMTVIARRAELIAWYERRGYARTGEVRPFPYAVAPNSVANADELPMVVLQRPLISRVHD